jgi:hypothetical protein
MVGMSEEHKEASMVTAERAKKKVVGDEFKSIAKDQTIHGLVE